MPTIRKSIREAKTKRGEAVMERVLNAAQSLLRHRWLSEISIVAVADEARVVRASLLLQFPGGWPDITYDLTNNLLLYPFERRVISLLETRRRTSTTLSVLNCLATFIDFAEHSGRLVPNLRGQMFVWGEENDQKFYLAAQDFNEEFAELLVGHGQSVTDAHRFAAEALINFALDLAGGAGLYPWTAKERRELVRKHVEFTLVGLQI